ncbi:unnamed protein product, partial [Rotaria magnacalcarata]
QYPDGMARSHIYSLPYRMNVMRAIRSTFSGGLFTNVRAISLPDLFCPFKHKIYDRIAHSFPRLTDLIAFNHKPRNYKPSHEAKKNNQMSSVIVFPHLTHIEICFGNINIAEQLLVDINMLLLHLINLTIPYSCIDEVTEDFTRDATRWNCANIKRLNFNRSCNVIFYFLVVDVEFIRCKLSN